MDEQNQKTALDYTLLFLTLLLMIISLVALYTVQPTLPSKYANFNFPLRQLQWYIAGSILGALIMFIDYDRFRKLTWLIYFVGLIPLFMIYFRFPTKLMVEFNDIVRGISIPLLGNIQPAEFMKIVLILTLGHVIASHNEKYIQQTIKSDLGLLLKVAAVICLPVGLIGIQPDLGSVLVLLAITTFMVLVSGIQWRVIFALIFSGGGVIGLSVVLWQYFPGKVSDFLEDSVFRHVKSRFYGWLHPEQYSDSGYQLTYTMRAIGSGRLFGKGFHGMEVNVPEKHTDMILTSIGEQFGFVGVSLLIVVYFLLVYRLLHIAIATNEPFGSYLIAGMIGMFTYQIFQNIGMSIQLLPITGLPLPFISYGGSSILTYLIAIALALNVHSRIKQYMFEED